MPRLPKLSAVHAVAPQGMDLPLGVFIKDSPEKALDTLMQLGYDGVEPNIADPLTFDANAYRRIAWEKGLEITAVSTGLSTPLHGTDLSHPSEEVRRKSLAILEAHLETARKLESPTVVIGVARGKCRGDCRTATERLRASLEHLNDRAHEAGVRLVLEPLNSYETDLINTVQEALVVIQGLSDVFLLVDTFHSMLEHPSPQEALLASAGRVGHIHFADSNRRAPGRGILDWRGILDALEKIGYKGPVSVEAKIMPDYGRELSLARETLLRALEGGLG